MKDLTSVQLSPNCVSCRACRGWKHGTIDGFTWPLDHPDHLGSDLRLSLAIKDLRRPGSLVGHLVSARARPPDLQPQGAPARGCLVRPAWARDESMATSISLTMICRIRLASDAHKMNSGNADERRSRIRQEFGARENAPEL
jgi:hypothetical protein